MGVESIGRSIGGFSGVVGSGLPVDAVESSLDDMVECSRLESHESLVTLILSIRI